MTESEKVFGEGFFTGFQWSGNPMARVPAKAGKSIRRVALMASLAAATVGFQGVADANDLRVPPAVETSSHYAGSVLGTDIQASPDDYLAAVEGGHKARSRATRILEFATEIGVPASRVAKIARGGVAVYWLSKEQIDGRAAARFALFECHKDRATLVLSNHDPEAIEVFEVKVSNLAQLVKRAIEYTA